ncbi:MAG TPA: hypothetical protein VEO00_03935 [Actinomycetota bacterium]|nr:hypothetical protein [Actinomycetota bacterium]
MDVAARIQQLEELITEAKSMPLSSSALVNREEVLELIQGLRQAMPEEIKQARWVVKDREELLLKARRDAEALIEKAHQEQGRLVARESVVMKSQEEAERILSEARDEARQIRLEAEDYVDAKLAAFEIALTKTREELDRTLAQVQRGRDKLRGTTRAQEQLAREEGGEGQ